MTLARAEYNPSGHLWWVRHVNEDGRIRWQSVSLASKASLGPESHVSFPRQEKNEAFAGGEAATLESAINRIEAPSRLVGARRWGSRERGIWGAGLGVQFAPHRARKRLPGRMPAPRTVAPSGAANRCKVLSGGRLGRIQKRRL